MHILKQVVGDLIDRLNETATAGPQMDLFRPLYQIHGTLGSLLLPNSRIQQEELRATANAALTVISLHDAAFSPPVLSGSQLALLLHLNAAIEAGSISATKTEDQPLSAASFPSGHAQFPQSLFSGLFNSPSPDAGPRAGRKAPYPFFDEMTKVILERRGLILELQKATGITTWSEIATRFPSPAQSVRQVQNDRNQIDPIGNFSLNQTSPPAPLLHEVEVLRKALRILRSSE